MTVKNSTATDTLTGVPVQTPLPGVMVYFTIPLPVRVWAIAEPLEADAPETDPLMVLTVQLKLVPGVVEDSAMSVVSPLQIVADNGVAVAVKAAG